MKALGRLGLALILTLGLSVTAEANTLFDNTSGSVTGSDGLNQGLWTANAFGTDNQTYQLDKITLWGYASAPSVTASLTILNSNGAVPGGDLKGTIAASSWSTNAADLANVFTPASPITLESNTEYWARLTVPDTNNTVYWFYSGTNPTVNLFGSTSSAGYWGNGGFPLYMMKVEATPVSGVPVPASIWLFGSALASYFGFTRRRVA